MSIRVVYMVCQINITLYTYTSVGKCQIVNYYYFYTTLFLVLYCLVNIYKYKYRYELELMNYLEYLKCII